MAPRATRNQSPPCDPDGMFAGMVVFLVHNGVQNRRLQIWKQKLVQMGATIELRVTKNVTHILAMNPEALLQEVGSERLGLFKGRVVLYQWLQDSLSSGEKVPEELYLVNLDADKSSSDYNSTENETPNPKKTKLSPENSPHTPSPKTPKALNEDQVTPLQSSSPYSPPDLNSNITQIFGKLINIYRALGDDRRSFSYYKAIPVIERLPFKIQSQDQVKGLPNIGKSMQDHIQEIVTTGKLSKLEHFETDEKVRTISLFGEVWGVGPATAQKLYEKGHRTLDDLKNEESLTNSQKLGLKYFDDIKQRIPRNEAQEMERLLQKAGEDVLPGVDIVCGGSYRRGKASCGDLDIIITHPDGKSHRGFLPKYVKHLKDMKFLREDLVFSTHSEEGTDSGVDTYFGLCTYPGRELRHRIDIKVYPREIYAFALIHWTGNDVLNRRLRVLAESKGFLLDDDGLFPATRGSLGQRGMRGSASLKFDTEKEVFEFLGFPWLEPQERNL
ncbi:putative DNA-directed DNA polymerase [Rosa chinensis]|uniref:DNA polymerase n=1 Tax=Rosa chinensis TaxID=74649 RepID=A0A2P6R485_ROSCH|nr:DNA polymerase lambda [Rosa chinensis]PRQ41218.1 putative DNA-directed DNA polymerase [Rosa chinensis]